MAQHGSLLDEDYRIEKEEKSNSHKIILVGGVAAFYQFEVPQDYKLAGILAGATLLSSAIGAALHIGFDLRYDLGNKLLL